MVYSPLFKITCLLVAIVGMGFLAGYCYVQELYSYMGLCLVLVLVFGLQILYLQRRTTSMINRMLDDIRYHDFSLHYSYNGKSSTERHMASQINEIINELKKVHLKYEEQTDYYKTLLDTIDSCLVVSNHAGKVIWLNRSAERLICGHAFHSLEELGSVDKKFPTLLKNMKPGDIKAIRIYKNDLAIDWAITLTEYLRKGVYYRLYHLRNIRSLLEENEMESWQKLVRVLTHEIMNSIAPIISLSETLTDYLPEVEQPVADEDSDSTNKKLVSTSAESERYEDDEDELENRIDNRNIIQQGLQTIHRRSKGLLDFVENYRKLTRIGTPVLTPVPINDLLHDLKNLFTDDVVEFQENQANCILMIDRTQIEQVLINLIKNAREACEEKPQPKVVVRTHFDEFLDIFMISVSDNGKGILPEVLDRIFVPFFTTKTTGSGIGLSICKQTMMLHGGSISVTSEPGKYTTFTLKFVDVKP